MPPAQNVKKRRNPLCDRVAEEVRRGQKAPFTFNQTRKIQLF